MSWQNTVSPSALFIMLTMSFAITSCEEKEPPVEEPPVEEPSINYPPEMGMVYVENITHNSAILYWGEAFDMEQDTLEYSVYLSDSMILVKASRDSLLYLSDLVPETKYEGKVQVSDPYHPPVGSNFTFTTQPDLIGLDRTFSGGAAFSIQQTDDRGYMVLGTQKSVEGINIPYVFRIDSLWRLFKFMHLRHFL